VKPGFHPVPAGPEHTDCDADGTSVTEVPFLVPWIELLVLPAALAITAALTGRGIRYQGRLLRPYETAMVIVLMAGWIITVIGGYALQWAWTGYPGNTLWDWLEMVLVPLVFLLVPYVFASCARRAFAIISELTAMAASDSPASSVPSSTRSSRSGVASPSSTRCRASLAELSASCRARCTPIVVGSVLLISLLSQLHGHVCRVRPHDH